MNVKKWLPLSSVLALAIACSASPEVVDDGDTLGTGGAMAGSGSGGKSSGSGGITLQGGSDGTGAASSSGGKLTGGPACGDGNLDKGEQCDDGNGKPADGCTGICTLEPGYTCDVPGEDCVLAAECGNSLIEIGEQCDLGDTEPNDGCDATCMVEAGWSCSPSGCEQQATAVCGDGELGFGEQCDDGEPTPVSGDGCSDTCKVENGYICQIPGTKCDPIQTEYCGNGILATGEDCDDGNGDPGDGCTDCAIDTGYTCPNANETCTIACGDGLVIGDEACDDGNTDAGDGCSADCHQIEAGYVCPIASGIGGTCVKPAPGAVCPNSKIEFGEGCDDGNTVNGDGCTGCTVDSGYVCAKPGTPCSLIPFCGDGFVDVQLGEQCDDGDAQSSDGCSSTCKVEANYRCPTPVLVGGRLSGGNCSKIVCGDGAQQGTEECDDSNTKANDGCSSTCKLESGWTCPLNASCQAASCGDGIIAGVEDCDNGAASNNGVTKKNNVICTAQCTIGSSAADCGNGVVDSGEACDDGNNDQGDGCSILCTKEPTCNPPQPCTSQCGDGIKFDTEGCDDGNLRDGDGCSKTCTVETGFTCTEQPSVTLPIVYRDFKYYKNGGHVDFQWDAGDPIDQTLPEDIWVRTTLGTAADTMPDGTSLKGKPISKWYVDCDGNGCTGLTPQSGKTQPSGTSNDPATCNAIKGSGTGIRWLGTGATPTATDRQLYYCNYGSKDFTAFSQWYRDVPGVNLAIRDTITLTETPAGSNTWVYEKDGFFPIDGKGFGNEGTSGHNFSFTSDFRYWFKYDSTANANLEFFGDDDVWVFVNGKLVVDISGTHGKALGSITLNGTAKDVSGNLLNLQNGKVYEIVVFHAERNENASNYKLTLKGFSLSKSVCKSTCGDGIKASNEQCDYGDTCAAGAGTCNSGRCSISGALCNDGSYGGCTQGPSSVTGCKLAPYCGDGTKNGTEDCDDGKNNTLYSSVANAGCSSGCKATPYCGDGVTSLGFEECDGGVGCDQCKLEAQCGDGAQDAGEECDDGALNGSLGSSCDTECHIKCGNGSIDAGEQCDPGTGNFSNGYGGCLPPVGTTQTGCILGPYCGDGTKQTPEEACDDGKNDGTYGTCSPMCVLPPRCGDGTVQAAAGEVCDNGAANVSAIYSLTGKGLCTKACRPAGYCGDGAVTNGEVCDDGKNDGTPGSCTADCSAWVNLTTCGNGNLDAGEECDAGTGTSGNGKAGSNCDTQCRFPCGNGIKDVVFGEECDDGVNNGSYGTCKSTCKFAAYCGDGTKNGPEGCDLGASNSSDPYGAGTCSTSCQPGPRCGDGRLDTSHGEECDGQVGCSTACKWIQVH